MNSLNTQSIRAFLGKHHPTIFIAFILILVTISVYSLYQIFDSELNKPVQTTSTIPSFDQTTIDNINKLRDSSDEGDPLYFPSPRANPFTE